jgi:nicotinate-nucleotide adenylyltransferase
VQKSLSRGSFSLQKSAANSERWIAGKTQRARFKKTKLSRPSYHIFMRIAFFGGSFDPPHNGHLAIARAAQQALDLDQVLFAPVGLQPLKPSGSSASFSQRAAMTRLAIAGQPHFELSLVDGPNPDGSSQDGPSSDGSSPVDRDARNSSNTPNYTSDTLTRLRQSLPPNPRLYLLLGADSFRTLPQWRHAAEIPFLADLIVASRPKEDLSDLPACLPPGIDIHPSSGHPNQYLLANSEGRQSQLTLLPNLHYDISATELRHQIHGDPSNQPPLIPEAVLQYIHHHHLYE